MSNTKMRRNTVFAVVAGLLAVGSFTGCSSTGEPEFRLAIDTKYAQIGCYFDFDVPGEWENRPWLRIGFPFWANFGGSLRSRSVSDGTTNEFLRMKYFLLVEAEGKNEAKSYITLDGVFRAFLYRD